MGMKLEEKGIYWVSVVRPSCTAADKPMCMQVEGQWAFTHLEFQADAVGFTDIKEFNKFSSNAVDALNILFGTRPNLDTIHF